MYRCLTYFAPETDRSGTRVCGIGQREGDRGGGSRGDTSVLDVQISVRHCVDVSAVNTHSERTTSASRSGVYGSVAAAKQLTTTRERGTASADEVRIWSLQCTGQC